MELYSAKSVIVPAGAVSTLARGGGRPSQNMSKSLFGTEVDFGLHSLAIQMALLGTKLCNIPHSNSKDPLFMCLNLNGSLSGEALVASILLCREALRV